MTLRWEQHCEQSAEQRKSIQIARGTQLAWTIQHFSYIHRETGLRTTFHQFSSEQALITTTLKRLKQFVNCYLNYYLALSLSPTKPTQVCHNIWKVNIPSGRLSEIFSIIVSLAALEIWRAPVVLDNIVQLPPAGPAPILYRVAMGWGNIGWAGPPPPPP